MPKPKVYFAGADNFGWGLDEDLRLAIAALENDVTMVENIQDAELIHSAWWEPFTLLPDAQLAGKRIISHIPAEPYRYLKVPAHRHALPKVGHWVARSTQGLEQCQRLNLSVSYIPYVVDTEIFRPDSATDSERAALIDKWDIPKDRYIIGNFHRDTQGHDLSEAKLVKGPDIFAEMMRVLVERGYPVHVLLAGPRRHWMRKTLQAYGVPYTYIGEITRDDDNLVNILPRSELNLLYSICDLYVTSSRSEGGPHSTMEACATKCKVISTRVGLAEDILEPESIYDTIIQGIDIIQRDVDGQVLDATIEPQYERTLSNHTISAVRPLFSELYTRWDNIPVYQPPPKRLPKKTWQKQLRRLVRKFRPGYSLGIWHTFFKPPYGGGNQFLLALRKAMLKQNINIIENKLSPLVDAYLLNSIHFDVEKFQKQHKSQDLKIVHRIDGPIFLIRGYDKEKDDLAFALNQELADSTVLQSIWSYERILEMGYRPVKPVIVNNAVDGDIFHTKERIEFSPERKIRLISSSWSDNPRKGGPLYKWLDENLDWDRFEYTFVGRASEEFENIKLVDPVPSEELANLLRQHDIYITASEKDPCSNALIEALQCGLPALYRNDGGHPELTGHGGLPFEDENDVLAQLDKLVAYYTSFQKLIVTQPMEHTSGIYLSLLKDAIAGVS